jgi:hypothetical protein
VNHIRTVSTELVWHSALQFSPDAGCPVLILTIDDDGFAVTMAQISPSDHEWRCVYDDSRLDPDDIDMWAEIKLPKFHN